MACKEKAQKDDVPDKLSGALKVFWRQPGPLCIAAGVLFAGLCRWQLPWERADAAVAAVITAWWLVEEWVIHAWLLHSRLDWVGKRIHEGHHAEPYFHMALDKPDLVLPAMVAHASFCTLLYQPKWSLVLTAVITIYSMGLLYTWTHYLVHTRVPMTTPIAHWIKEAHMSHHLKDHRHWMSFSFPGVDILMGTSGGYVKAKN